MKGSCFFCKNTTNKVEKNSYRFFCNPICQKSHYFLIEGKKSSEETNVEKNDLDVLFQNEMEQRNNNGKFFLNKLWGTCRVVHVTLKNGFKILMFGEYHDSSIEKTTPLDVRSLNVKDEIKFYGKNNNEMTTARFMFGMISKLFKNQTYADLFIEINPLNVWDTKQYHGEFGIHTIEHLFRKFDCNMPKRCKLNPYIKIHYSDIRFTTLNNNINLNKFLLHEIVAKLAFFLQERYQSSLSSQETAIVDVLGIYLADFFNSLDIGQTWVLTYFDIIWRPDPVSLYNEWVYQSHSILKKTLQKILDKFSTDNNDLDFFIKQQYTILFKAIIKYFDRDEEPLRWKKCMKIRKQYQNMENKKLAWDIVQFVKRDAKREYDLLYVNNSFVDAELNKFDPTFLTYFLNVYKGTGQLIIAYGSALDWEMDLYLLLRLFRSFTNETSQLSRFFRLFSTQTNQSLTKIIYVGDMHISKYITMFQQLNLLQSTEFLDHTEAFAYLPDETIYDAKDDRKRYTKLSELGAKYLNSLI